MKNPLTRTRQNVARDGYVGPDFLGLHYRKNRTWATVGSILSVVLVLLGIVLAP